MATIDNCHFCKMVNDYPAEHLGQRIAKSQKKIYSVERVGFVYTGGDIAHVHAHVVPLYEKTDITSLKYIERTGSPEEMTSDGMKELEKITKNLRSTLENVQ